MFIVKIPFTIQRFDLTLPLPLTLCHDDFDSIALMFVHHVFFVVISLKICFNKKYIIVPKKIIVHNIFFIDNYIANNILNY